jgi:hypothetical protein
MYDLAILALSRNLAERDVAVRIATHKLRIVMYADAFVFSGIRFGNLERPIRTAVVDDAIFPILIGLRQDTLDTFDKVLFSVVDGCEDTYQRLFILLH